MINPRLLLMAGGTLVGYIVAGGIGAIVGFLISIWVGLR